MLLGVKTDSLDTEGKIIGQSDKFVTDDKIREILAQMLGKIKQAPPAYSAVKHCGEPLYKYARKGIFLEKPPRDVEIYSIVIENICFPRVTFRVVCSKGTYIRVLCSEVGELLGCGACLCGLRRIRSGFFLERMAISLNNSEYTDKKNKLLENMLPMEELLPLMTAIELEDNCVLKLRNGLQPSVEMMKAYVLPFLEAGDMVKFITSTGYIVALAEWLAPVNKFSEFDGKRQAARIIRVFNNISN
jgi:tRNA pseudouridine55 synthase